MSLLKKIVFCFRRSSFFCFLKKNKKIFALISSFFIIILISYKFYRIEKSLPDVSLLTDYEPSVPTIIYSANGFKIAEIFSERRYPVKIESISPWLKKAFIAAEDANFYHHHGFSWKGFLRAVYHFVTFSNQLQGGSTLTQQLAKNLLLTKERTIERKIKDILLARKIEKEFSKEKILEMYLNAIYLGNDSYGVEAAAENYFHKDNKKVSLAEAALIAGLAPAPSAYNPTENFNAAKTRQKYVLEQMLKQKFITEKQYKTALEEKISVYKSVLPNNIVAPYFVAEVKKQLEQQLDLDDLETSGLKVYTTLDTRIQSAAQSAIAEFSRNHASRVSFAGPIAHHSRDLKSAFKVLLADENQKSGGEIQKAIVIDIDDNQNIATIITASGIGILCQKDLRWVLSAGRNKSTNLQKVSNILAVGDEVHVKRVSIDLPSRLKQNKNFIKHLLQLSQNFDFLISKQKMACYTLTDTKPLEAAALVMDSKTGAVLAMVGGISYLKSQFNRAVQAERQVGSSVKPLYYSYAVDLGFSPVSLIDSPIININGWKPKNYGGETSGRVTLLDALKHSYNIPSIFLYQTIGAQKVARQLNRFGFHWPATDLSLSLGSGSASLIKMVQAYSIFPNQGRMSLAYEIEKIIDRHGKVLFNAEKGKIYNSEVTPLNSEDAPYLPGKTEINQHVDTSSLQMVSPQAAYVTLQMLSHVVSEGTGRAAKGAGSFVAGKTGTTNGYTDAWFLGISSQRVAGVWVGYDDNSQSLGDGGSGGILAAPVWKAMMLEAERQVPQKQKMWEKPDGIIDFPIHSEHVMQNYVIPLIAGTEPGGIYARNALIVGANTKEIENDSVAEKQGLPTKELLPLGIPNAGQAH